MTRTEEALRTLHSFYGGHITAKGMVRAFITLINEQQAEIEQLKTRVERLETTQPGGAS